jgi:hypothetical protein
MKEKNGVHPTKKNLKSKNFSQMEAGLTGTAGQPAPCCVEGEPKPEPELAPTLHHPTGELNVLTVLLRPPRATPRVVVQVNRFNLGLRRHRNMVGSSKN